MDGSRAIAAGLPAHESDEATAEHGPVAAHGEHEPTPDRMM